MQAIRRPSIPEIRAFGRLSPETPAIREMPMIPRAKYSTEVNFETALVMSWAQSRSSSAENRPPKVEAKRETSRAFLTLPFLASG